MTLSPSGSPASLEVELVLACNENSQHSFRSSKKLVTAKGAATRGRGGRWGSYEYKFSCNLQFPVQAVLRGAIVFGILAFDFWQIPLSSPWQLSSDRLLHFLQLHVLRASSATELALVDTGAMWFLTMLQLRCRLSSAGASNCLIEGGATGCASVSVAPQRRRREIGGVPVFGCWLRQRVRPWQLIRWNWHSLKFFLVRLETSQRVLNSRRGREFDQKIL